MNENYEESVEDGLRRHLQEAHDEVIELRERLSANLADEPTLEKAIRTTRGLGISAKQAQEEELHALRQEVRDLTGERESLQVQLSEQDGKIRAYEKNWAPKRDLVEARHRRDEAQKLLDRALAQVAERDAQLRNQELTISHLHGQIAALDRVFAMGQQAAAQALYGPQVDYAELDRGYAKEQGLDEDDVPPRREEPALAGVQQRVVDQLKSAGINTSSICGYEWVAGHDCEHACGIVNPLHLGDHECEQGCGVSCSQQEAERIEEAKQRADSNG